MRKIICSACLLGINCKYNGKNNLNRKVLARAKKEVLIPVCPEQLGGLATPRPRVCRKRRKVVNEFDQDTTVALKKGAAETLKIAKLVGAKAAILKQKSPSCGTGRIYADFSGKVIRGNGVTAELLKKKGIKVISEEEL